MWDKHLSSEQIDQYRDQGFLLIPDAVPGEILTEAKRAALNLVDNFDASQHPHFFSAVEGDNKNSDQYFIDSQSKISCFLEVDALDVNGQLQVPKQHSVNKIGHALELQSPFRELCQLPVFWNVPRDLGYTEPEIIQTMYILKSPRIGGEVCWHQDATYLNTQPASVMGVWLALEPASKENGCLWVEPGGHKTPLRSQFFFDPDKQTSWLDELDKTPWPELSDAVPVEVPEGTVVIFSDHLPHYSSHNYSNQSRHAFTAHIKEKSAPWHPLNWIQRSGLVEPKHQT